MARYLSDYIDGDLGSRLKKLIDAHRGECPPCEAFVRTLKKTIALVAAQPREPLSPGRRRALARALRLAGGVPRRPKPSTQA